MKLRNQPSSAETTVQVDQRDTQIAETRSSIVRQLSRGITGIFHERKTEKAEDTYVDLVTQKIVEKVGLTVDESNVAEYNQLVQAETVERRSALTRAMEKTRKIMITAHMIGAVGMQAGAVLGAEQVASDPRLSTVSKNLFFAAAGLTFGAGVQTQLKIHAADQIHFGEAALAPATALINPEDAAAKRSTQDYLSMRLGEDMSSEFWAVADYKNVIDPYVHTDAVQEERFVATS